MSVRDKSSFLVAQSGVKTFSYISTIDPFFGS